MTDWTKDRHASARRACEDAKTASGNFQVLIEVPAFKAALDEIERLQGLVKGLATTGRHGEDCNEGFDAECDCGWSDLVAEAKRAVGGG